MTVASSYGRWVMVLGAILAVGGILLAILGELSRLRTGGCCGVRLTSAGMTLFFAGFLLLTWLSWRKGRWP